MKTAAPKDRSYLEQLNFKQLQKGKKPEGNPKEYYKQIQEQSKSGPVFNTKTLDLVDGLPDLPKPITKWIANLAVKDKLDDIKPTELGMIIDWISKTSDGNKIHNMTWDEAVSAQNKWKNQEGYDSENLGEYVTNDVVMRLPDGYKIVQITNPEDIHTEGKIMQNCLKDGSYDEDVANYRSEIYSLRDSSNEPHASIEIVDGEVRQCYGKQNKTPIAKYAPYLREFFENRKYSEWEHMIDDTSIEHVRSVVRDGSRGRLVELIHSDTITDESLMFIIDNSSLYAMREIAAKKDASTEVLSYLYSKFGEDPRVSLYLARNNNTGGDVLINISKVHDTDTDIARSLVEQIIGDAIGRKLARSMANSADDDVREALADCRHLPMDLFESLSVDKSSSVRRGLAFNNYLPPKIAEILAVDPHVSVRIALAMNTNIPEMVLELLASDVDERVRRSVVSNYRTPQRIKDIAKQEPA